eukprot:scaffold56327_cov68-Phaeocystis_antarctica.AAC.12
MRTATSPARTPKEPTARSTLLASDEAHSSEHCPIALAGPASAASTEQASRRAAPSGTRGSSGDASHAARGPKHSSSRSRVAHALLPLRRCCRPSRVAASTACAATASKSVSSHSTCAQGSGTASEAGVGVEALLMTGDGEGTESSPLHIYLYISTDYASPPWPMRRGRRPPRDITSPARRRRRPPRRAGSSRSCTAATVVAPPT